MDTTAAQPAPADDRPRPKRSTAVRAACVLGLLWTGLVLLTHLVATGLACGWDTSYCTKSRHKDGLYRGTLGPAFGETSFSVAFESRRSEQPRLVGGFTTDESGRYCIVWSQEYITPFLYADRLQSEPMNGRWTPLDGEQAPDGCQEGNQGIPWNRARDLGSSPQSVAVWLFTLAGALGLALGLMRPVQRPTILAGAGCVTVSTLLVAVLWLL